MCTDMCIDMCIARECWSGICCVLSSYHFIKRFEVQLYKYLRTTFRRFPLPPTVPITSV